jgi:hypothetical protein
MTMIALLVGEQELLREIGEDADAVDALVDHQVHDTPVALDIEVAVVVEDGRRDRQDALVGFGHGVVSGGGQGGKRTGNTDVRQCWRPWRRASGGRSADERHQQQARPIAISVETSGFDQKIESEPWLKIIDWRKASSALSPMTMASTSGAIG